MEIQLPLAALVGFCFALVRTTAWITICPPFNSPAVPLRVRVGIAAAVSFVIADELGGEVTSLALGPFLLALLTQALAGLALGFTVYVLFSAIQAAGDLIDLQVGFSLGEAVGVDLWRYESADGRGIRKALDFLAPYADADTQWPYPDLQTVRPQRLRPFLTKALKVFGDERYRNWLDKLPDDDPDSRELLLAPPIHVP